MKKLESRFILFFLFVFLVAVVSVLIAIIEKENFHSFFDAFWWSIVTISTVGYGDIVPQTTAGRALAVIIILSGVVIMSLFTATITTYLIEKRLFGMKPYEKTEQLNHHLIICGFKPACFQLIEDIASNQQIALEQIVIIYEELNSEITKALEAFEGIKFIAGDYTDENLLLRAKADHAAKAIILADATTASDSHVLATTILLKSLRKEIYVVAEISDKKFENYLLKAGCDEVILSESFNNYILSRSISSPGLSKVVGELLQSENSITILLAESGHIHKTFQELFSEFFENDAILIGVIENYGSAQMFKDNAVKQAQLAANISDLVTNLQNIKSMEKNKIVLKPSKTYTIRRNSALILLKKVHG